MNCDLSLSKLPCRKHFYQSQQKCSNIRSLPAGGEVFSFSIAIADHNVRMHKFWTAQSWLYCIE